MAVTVHWFVVSSQSVGRELSCHHMEKLCKLVQLPPLGFTVACFPAKVKAASRAGCGR
jgi:hypothetical protein